MSRDSVLQPFRPPVDLQIDYANELNPQQRAAVTAPPGPALVIAGAGAGKTRTLIYRVAFLLEQGIPADRILLLTFTNKAAKEMMRRVTDLLGGDLSSLWGGTFHSIGNRILRRHADLLGYARNFTILDREDAKDLIVACLDEAGIDMKTSGFPKADVLADIFSLAMNTGKALRQIIEEQYDDLAPLAPQIEGMARRYAERKRADGVMDFDDLLVLWLKLLRDHAEVREQYQRRFQFILVDEYQDTNKLQSDLIDLLAERHHNVMVVGDDSQSIYSWRGADFHNIFQFPQRYPETTIYKIETNYRSTPEILSLANAAIAANARQYAKQLTATRQSGVKPVLVPCGDAGEQAAFVARRVLALRDEGMNLNDLAVLYRSHFHALELQLELTRRNIPFSITSGIRFFEQSHIKDVAAYLKLVCNPRDELAFKRLARLLPGIGGKGADKLWQVFDDVSQATLSTPHGIAPRLQKCAQTVPKKAAAAWAQFAATISQLEDDSARAGGGLRRLFAGALHEFSFSPGRARSTGRVRPAVFKRRRVSHPTGAAHQPRSGRRPAGRVGHGANPPLDHSPGQGTRIRRRFHHHAVRGIVSLSAFAADGRGRGRGTAVVLRGHYAGEERTVPELSVGSLYAGRQRQFLATPVPFSGRNSGGPSRGVEPASV